MKYLLCTFANVNACQSDDRLLYSANFYNEYASTETGFIHSLPEQFQRLKTYRSVLSKMDKYGNPKLSTFLNFLRNTNEI